MKKHQIKDFALMNVGVIVMTLGIYFFKVPNGFATGGVSGVGTILGRLTPISTSLWISGINAALLILGFLVLGKATGAKTVYCSTLFSLLMCVLEQFVPLSAPITGQPFMELVYAIVLTSFGSALLFQCHASSGGTDILALILKKYTRMKVGNALLCVDFVIACSSFFVFGIEAGLFSLLGLFMKAFLVDTVTDSLNSCKYFVVITAKGEVISQYIMATLHRGVTISDAHGGYTGDGLSMIHTVCSRLEAIRLRAHIKEIDAHAFVIIMTSNEIIGRGFRGV